MPIPLTPPYGRYARVLYREGTGTEIDVVLDSSAGDFRGEAGQKGRMGLLGWDRQEVDEAGTVVSQESARGTSFQVGPDYRRPFLLMAQLLLSEQKYRQLEAIFERQQESPAEGALLFDHRLMLAEPSPRSRARFDAATTAGYVPPGMVLFWPIFVVEVAKIEILSVIVGASGAYRYSVNVDFRERLPPLGAGGDRAWSL